MTSSYLLNSVPTTETISDHVQSCEWNGSERKDPVLDHGAVFQHPIMVVNAQNKNNLLIFQNQFQNPLNVIKSTLLI